MIWVKRFLILCSPLWIVGFFLFHFDFIPEDFKNFFIFLLLVISNVLLLIFGKKYKNQRLQDVKINWKDSWKWILFYFISIYFGLSIGHFLTAGIDREKIGVGNAFDIEHSFRMANDDLSVALRCASPNIFIDFLGREREHSYYIINWRKYGNLASTNKIQKSGNMERGMEMLGIPVEKNDWVKPICENGWEEVSRKIKR